MERDEECLEWRVDVKSIDREPTPPDCEGNVPEYGIRYRILDLEHGNEAKHGKVVVTEDELYECGFLDLICEKHRELLKLREQTEGAKNKGVGL